MYVSHHRFSRSKCTGRCLLVARRVSRKSLCKEVVCFPYRQITEIAISGISRHVHLLLDPVSHLSCHIFAHAALTISSRTVFFFPGLVLLVQPCYDANSFCGYGSICATYSYAFQPLNSGQLSSKYCVACYPVADGHRIQ